MPTEANRRKFCVERMFAHKIMWKMRGNPWITRGSHCPACRRILP